MELTIREVVNDHRTKYKDRVLETHKVVGNTIEECFKKAYPYERSLRYCSGYYIRFETTELYKQFVEWKKTGVTIDMFYGNGTVD